MNVQSVIIIAVVAVLAVAAVVYCIKNRSNISCGGDCSNCPSNCKKDK